MDINRNQWFLFGLVLLFLGIQFRVIDSYVLTEDATRVLSERFGTKSQAMATNTARFLPAVGAGPRKVIRPPDWLGWALMSAGSVLILHSFAMKRPEG